MSSSPGLTQFTRTFGAHSTARDAVEVDEPRLAAPYADAPAKAAGPTLATLTMQPPSSWSAITLCADWAHQNGARRLSPTMASTKRGDTSAAGTRVSPRVVHQHVEAPELLHRLGHNALGVGRLAHVRVHEDRAVDLGVVATARDDVGPRIEEAGDDPRPDPSRPSGHDDHRLEVERLWHHGQPPYGNPAGAVLARPARWHMFRPAF